MRTRTKVVLTVTIALVLVLSVLGALMIFNKSPDLLNSEFRVIVTGSMDGEPTDYEISTIPVDSLIAVHKLQGDAVNDVKVGDVIGFYSPSVGGNVYHRVIAIDEVDHKFTTHGDANAPGANESVAFDEVNGIVVNVSHGAGEAVSFVKSNILYLVVIVILLLIMAEAFHYLIKTWKE